MQIYHGEDVEKHQIDVQHMFHDTPETFEVYECPACHGHFLVESEALDSITTISCPYCKFEFEEEDDGGG